MKKAMAPFARKKNTANVPFTKSLRIINRNLLGNESSASEKLCTVLYGTDSLKITIKCHTACCVCQDYISNSCPIPMHHRLHMSGLENKTLQTCRGKKFFGKIQQRK